MKRPAMSMPMFWDAQVMMDPITQIIQPTWMAVLRPNLSERKPEAMAPTKEPPGIEAVIPP